jgi:non-canonical (house-cleaning) NTP pyrophosphatase
MNKIVVASKSPLKAQVVRDAAKEVFPESDFEIVQCDVETDASEPIGRDLLVSEIKNHMDMSRSLVSDGFLYIGMEGGIENTDQGMEEIALVVVRHSNGLEAVSRSASFPVPPSIANLVKSGIPFAKAVDQVYSTVDIKNTQGFVGLLTDNIVDKYKLYFQPTAIVLSRIKKDQWFK